MSAITYPIQHDGRTFTPAGEIATRDDRACADCGAALHRPEHGSIFPQYAIIDGERAVCVPCADKRELVAFSRAEVFVGYFDEARREITTFSGTTLARVTASWRGFHNMAGHGGIRYWRAIGVDGARWYGKYCPAWRQLTAMRRTRQ